LSDTANTNAESEQKKPRRTLAGRLFRYTALSGLFLLLIIAAGIGYTETATFRSMMRDFIVETVDSNLNGHLTIDRIDGNIFSGWKISGVTLVDDHGPVAEIESIVLRYNLFRIPWQIVTVRELTLNAPKIYITRGEGRDWNINTLVPPTEDEDTTSGAFDWDIRVENLRILDGMLLVYDSSSGGPPRRDRLDAEHMQLTDMNLALSASITDADKRLSLNRLSWRNALGDVGMENMSGDILVTRHGFALDQFSVQTGRSGMILSAAVDSVDLLTGFDTDRLADLPFRLQFNAPEVDLRDLQYYLPSLDILGGSARLELEARGTMRSIDLQHLRLDAGESSIAFSGQLRDVLDGADMIIDVTSTATRIHGDDIPKLLPGIPIMDLSEIGTASFSLLRFNGHPLDFEGALDMESDAGDIAGSLRLDLTGQDLVYDAVVRTRGLDLARILKNQQLRSSLTLQAGIKGKGTTLGSIVAQLNVQADSSRFQRYVADQLRLSVDVRTDSLTLDLRSRLGASSIACDGGMSFRPDSITGFRLEGNTSALDLAMMLNDDEMSSELTFSFIANGDGVDLATSSGRVEVAIEQSRFQDIVIERDTFRLALQQSIVDAEYMLLESQYADARIDGRFDFPRFFEYMSLQADSLSAALRAFAFAPDSAALAEAGGTHDNDSRGSSGPAARTGQVVPDTAAFMDVSYSIKLKNPERIARYFDARSLLVRGTYRGTIRGGYNGFGVVGELHLSDFYLIDSARTWLAAGVRCSYDIGNLRLDNPLENLIADIRFAASDLHFNGLRMSRTSIQFDYKDARPTIRVRSMLDTMLQVDVQAEAIFADYGFDVSFPLMKLQYLGEDWNNDGTLRMRVDSLGFAIDRFALKHGRMRFSLLGTRSFDGENSLTLYGDSLDLGMIEYFATGNPAAREGQSFSGAASLEANISGTDVAPLMAAAVYIDSLGYKGMHFGELALEGRYYDQRLELYSELGYDKEDGTQEKVFFISGTVPTGLTFNQDEEVSIDNEAEANLRIQMREFPLPLIEEFLGLFSPLEGSAFGDITVTGTAENPSFNGYLTISNASGRFVFNNMDYTLNLRIEAVEQDIRIVKATVENTDSDWKDGLMTASGTISTEAFSISTFDLAVAGKLKVLRPASRSAMRSLYGDLFISTGTQNLTYTGRLDRSRLTGNIVIEGGELTFPLEQAQTGVNKYADIKYIVVDDTTTQVVSSLSAGRFGRLARGESGGDEEGQKPERSVLDGLSYDLTFSTAGRLNVEIPFSVLQEELNAALEFDDLKISSFGAGGMKFVGEVKLGSESSYIFLGKRMSAEGSLRFTRDPMNPDLDLTAVYSDYYIDPKTDVRRQVFVTIRITGTKQVPKLAYDMRWDDINGEAVAAGGDVQSDAFSFVLFGVFAKDFSSSEGDRSSLVAKSPEFFNQLGSSLASSAATQFLSRAGLNDVIKRIDFSGLGTEDSRVKLTSEIGQSIITYDGKINDLESSNITVEFPLSRILGIPLLNQVVQVSRITTNQTLDSSPQAQEYSVWELKILQRFSF
jgi:hypothetical protein